MIIEKKTLSDGIYHTEITIEKNIRYITDIATAIEMTRIANRFDEACEKIKLMTKEEKDDSIIKVNNCKSYSQREKEYLLWRLQEH